MTAPSLVADVGNTRVKWGVCSPDAARVQRVLSLPDDADDWERARAQFPPHPLTWAIASVRPERSDRLLRWLHARGDEARLLRNADLPLMVNVEQPARVGIDRLLNAVAAIPLLNPGEPAILVDAGSAVTVDYLNTNHVFEGGAIFPGLVLMAKALHDYTAQLPLVEVDRRCTLGKSTVEAIRAGAFHAVHGGICSLVESYAAMSDKAAPRLFFTGGQSELLYREWHMDDRARHWAEMTLTGVLVAARGLP